MPGDESMGEQATWTNGEEIKTDFLEPVRKRLEERMGRPVELHIETEKHEMGPIDQSMFREAFEADVYIADLTGGNPNVYLELGTRWALRKGVTIPVYQKGAKIRFNAQNARAVAYESNAPALRKAIDSVVDAAVHGLTVQGHNDSPVLAALPVTVLNDVDHNRLLDEITHLRRENARFHEERAANFIEAAEIADTVDQRIALLQEAIGYNPASPDVHLALGVALRLRGRYSEATDKLQLAEQLAPNRPEISRELGVALSRAGELEPAVAAFRRSLALDPDNEETSANLGGTYRRMARAEEIGGQVYLELLEEARKAYAAAGRANDSYAALNEAIVELLLSRGDPKLQEDVQLKLVKLRGLAEYQEYKSDSGDAWKLLDLASILVLTGQTGPGIDKARLAIELIPQPEYRSYLEPTIDSLGDCVAARVVPEPVADGVQMLIDELRAALEGPPTVRRPGEA
jgi:tetratricopeptide (TPR) repeat protein